MLFQEFFRDSDVTAWTHMRMFSGVCSVCSPEVSVDFQRVQKKGLIWFYMEATTGFCCSM